MVLAKFNPMCTTEEHFNNHMIKRRDDPLQYIFFSSEILTPPFIFITILIFLKKKINGWMEHWSSCNRKWIGGNPVSIELYIIVELLWNLISFHQEDEIVCFVT
jgi:hypothetical protein